MIAKEFIAHRINTIDELRLLDKTLGVEIDIRSWNGDLVLVHDPLIRSSVRFEDYLSEYKQNGTLILNIKEEMLEYRIIELLKEYNITNYFFLDSSFPMINKLSSIGEHNVALRFSEYEGMDTLISMSGRVKWVWVDCFSKLPLDKNIFNTIRRLDYKLCLVSPELQGREEDILAYREFLIRENIVFDAVCTKHYNIDIWNNEVNND